MSDDTTRGMYGKYHVEKRETGERVTECFVLRYDKDPFARAALKAYANACCRKHPQLAEDIWKLIHEWDPK